MLRILLFSPKGSGTHYYGPGMSAYRMYNSLDKQVASVSLAHGCRDQGDTGLFEQQYFISEIDSKNVFSGVKFLMNAKRWIKENAHRFDVVHCLSAFHHPFMMAVWFEKMGVPAFIKISESKYAGFSESSLQSTLLGLKRYRLKNANKITGYLSISSEIRQKLLDAGIDAGRIHNIPNGVDIDRFKPVSEPDKRNLRRAIGFPDKFTVIFTGSFSERKNPYLVAQAFSKFSRREDIQLLLIGPDREGSDQRKKIYEFIAQNRIKNIRVMDFVQNIELYYQASNLFVLTSNQEGFSNSMLEAQACGLPAIVTRISGSEDLIDESVNGKFVNFTPRSVAAAIEEYYKNREKCANHSRGARERIVKKYSSETVLQKHLELFLKAQGTRFSS